MKVHNVRWLAALACACALSACAGSSSSDNATATSAPAAVTNESADGSNPCHMPGGWNFGGACTSGALTSAGGTFVLPSYRNVSAVFDYGRNDATRDVAFVVGDATGDRDITGLLNGALPFPIYGSVACLSPRGAPVVCQGKAMLYLLVINVSNIPVRFASSPRIQISSLTGFPGKLCEIETMVVSNAQQPKAAWRSHAWTASVNGKTATFLALPSSQGYKNQGALVVYAVTCS
jgi:hypothetical protein